MTKELLRAYDAGTTDAAKYFTECIDSMGSNSVPDAPEEYRKGFNGAVELIKVAVIAGLLRDRDVTSDSMWEFLSEMETAEILERLSAMVSAYPNPSSPIGLTARAAAERIRELSDQLTEREADKNGASVTNA